MSTLRVPLIQGTTGTNIGGASPGRLVNMYPLVAQNVNQNGGWRNTPGWHTVYADTLSSVGNIIKVIAFKQRIIMLTDEGNVYSWDYSSSSPTLLGRFQSVADVAMAQDGLTCLVCAGGVMKLYREGATALEDVTTANPYPHLLIFHNGHYIAAEKGSGRFYISDKFDGSTWDPLQFATAEDKPDDIVGLGSDRHLLIFGSETTQVYDSRELLFPFQPNPQGRMVYGMLGRTWALVDNRSYWLSRNEHGAVKVLRTNGIQPELASTPYIEAEFSKYNGEAAFAQGIQWQGREWYILTFPDDGKTFVYDPQGAWFEWLDYDTESGELVQHPMLSYLYYRGHSLFVDGTASMKRLDDSKYDHAGKPMISFFQSGIIQADERRLVFDRLVLDMLTGVGGSVECAVSWDAGRTYGQWRPVSLGEKGDSRWRVQWHRLGSGYKCAVAVRISDPVPREILNGVGMFSIPLSRKERAAGYRPQV